MADEKTVLQYKGRPLMRKDNMIYYGSMADSHIVMLQILETKKVQDTDIATRVSVELQLTDPCVQYGCPELCPCFCDSDDITCANLHPKLLRHRTGTLGRGNACCDICLRIKE